MNNLLLMLGSWANMLPTLWRKRVYQAVKVVSALTALALLVLPELPSVGVHWSKSEVAMTVLAAVLSFTNHLADRNTLPEPALDTDPAPEHGNPEPPQTLGEQLQPPAAS